MFYFYFTGCYSIHLSFYLFFNYFLSVNFSLFWDSKGLAIIAFLACDCSKHTGIALNLSDLTGGHSCLL